MTYSNTTDRTSIIGNAARSVTFEGLEDRKLMAGISFAHNTLTVIGTDKADDIRVSLSSDGRTLSAKLNNGAAKTFKAADVYEINVEADCGDNKVTIDSKIKANVEVTAGDGRDTIQTGSGNDNVDAGENDDRVDTGAGNDYVYGGKGDDRIDLGAGNDRADGADGKDTISSGTGKDAIRGQNDNDVIYAKKGDTVDGGAGRNNITISGTATGGSTGGSTGGTSSGGTSGGNTNNSGPSTPVVTPQVRSLSLVNADTGAVINGYESLTDGMTLDLSKLPAHLTVVASTNDYATSAKFTLSDGSINRIDSLAKYSLTASNGNAFNAWNPASSLNSVKLSVTPYSKDNAAGTAGATKTLTLNLKRSTTNNGGSNPTPTPVPIPSGPTGGAGAPTIKANAISTTVIAGQAFHAEAASTIVPGYQAEDAQFSWDFGDPTGRWNNLPGFNSAHVYETPGKYTAKLTVTAPGGQKSVQTITVNVVASNYKVIYVAANGSDSNNGTSQNSPVKSLSKALAMSGDNTQILFKRGDVFQMSSSVSISRNNLVLGSYGSGTTPTLLYTGSRSGTPNMVIVTNASKNVTIENLTFDSIYKTNFNEAGMPHAIVAGGTATTIRGNTFLNLAYAINANVQPKGLLVMDNKAPLTTGLRAYFVWAQGSDLVIVGNTVANSTRQHNVRSGGTDRWAVVYNSFSNLDRTKSGDTADVAKGTIVAQRGSYIYAAYNELRGPVGVGPLGMADGLNIKEARFNHAAFEGNIITGGGTLDVHHGANNITLRGNTLYTDAGLPSFKVEGWSNSYGRGVSDVVIDHNIAITQATSGKFLWLLASVDGVTVTNNVYIAPNLTAGSAGTAAVYVSQKDLSSFKLIDNNTWPATNRSNGFARGGLAFVGTDYTSANHKTPSEWNSLNKVGNDKFTDVAMDNIENVILATIKPATQAGLRLAA